MTSFEKKNFLKINVRANRYEEFSKHLRICRITPNTNQL